MSDRTQSRSDPGTAKRRKRRSGIVCNWTDESGDDSADSDFVPGQKKAATVDKVQISRIRRQARSNKNKSTPSSDSDGETKTRSNVKVKTRSKSRPIQPQRSAHSMSNTAATLPHEILLKIFFYLMPDRSPLETLEILSQVCMQWKFVASDPLLWRRLDLSRVRRPISALKRLTKTGMLEGVRSLDLTSCSQVDVAFMTNLIKTSPSLEELIVEGSPYATNPSFMESLLKKSCRNLRSLNASGLSLNSHGYKEVPNMTRRATWSVRMLSGWDHLSSLNLSGICFIMSTASFFRILLEFRGLIALDLSMCSFKMQEAATLPIGRMQQCMPNLRSLRLSEFPCTNFQTADDIPGFPKLMEFGCNMAMNRYSQQSNSFTAETLDIILGKSPLLEVCDIAGWKKDVLTYRFLSNHLRVLRMPSLGECTRAINMDDVHDFGMYEAPALEEISLAWSRIPEKNVRSLFECLTSLKCLQHAQLSGLSGEDESIRLLITKCENLTSVDLSSMRGLSRGLKRRWDSIAELKIRLGEQEMTS